MHSEQSDYNVEVHRHQGCRTTHTHTFLYHLLMKACQVQIHTHTFLYVYSFNFTAAVIFPSWYSVHLIGASLSEPHTDRKASPRAIYMYLFFNVRTSFRKCPHVLFHWLFKFTFAHCTCTTNRVWASDRTTTNNNPSSIWSLNKRTAELCPSWTTRTAYSTKS